MVTSVVVPDIELYHRLVHIILFRETYSLPLQPLQMRPEVQVVTLYVPRAMFTRPPR